VGTNDNKVVGGLDQVSGYATAGRPATGASWPATGASWPATGASWPATGASWRSAAACRSADPELFFPLSESGRSLEQIGEAKAICTGCPVRRQCLQFALRTRAHGIWGGLTELERHHGRRPAGDGRPQITRTV
jgi:WhiB family transcriptional regulator, redox-sensing transcriptional regulator